MKKFFASVLSVCLAGMLCSGIAGCGGEQRLTGEQSASFYSRVKEAQFFPLPENIVTSPDGEPPENLSPAAVADGFSQAEYSAFIGEMSELCTPLDEEFDIAKAQGGILAALDFGILPDEWISYEGGYPDGKFYFSETGNEYAALQFTSYRPDLYGENDEEARADCYLLLRYFEEGGSDVAECEYVENLCVGGKVTPLSYQYLRHTEGTSFTRLSVISRAQYSTYGRSGLDDISDLPYGYIREFTQLDYRDTDNVCWLQAGQLLPHAFSLSDEYYLQLGTGSPEAGFTCSVSASYRSDTLAEKPSDEYLTLPDTEELSLCEVRANVLGGKEYLKQYAAGEHEDHFCNASSFSSDERRALEEGMHSILSSLLSFAGSFGIRDEAENELAGSAFDCSASNDVSFEEAIGRCLDVLPIIIKDGSELAQSCLSDEIYLQEATKLWSLPHPLSEHAQQIRQRARPL